MEKTSKKRGEKGSAVILMVATIVILGVIGYVLGSMVSNHQESIPVNMDSARAFVIAQSGVEYVGKYLQGADFTTVAAPPTMNLGTGAFGTVFTSATPGRIVATITGNSGTATRRITVRFQNGGAIISRGPINPMNNPNGIVVCDASTSCNTSNIHDCECTQENVPASVIPDIPVPNPQPPAVPAGQGGCNTGANNTYTIAAGTYYCPTYQVGNNSSVNLAGPVVIFCQTFDLSNQADVNWNAGSLASNLVIIASTQVTVGQNVNFKGAIYAPGSNVFMDNSSTLTGMVVGNVVSVSNHYTVNYDPTAAAATPYSTVFPVGSADWLGT